MVIAAFVIGVMVGRLPQIVRLIKALLRGALRSTTILAAQLPESLGRNDGHDDDMIMDEPQKSPRLEDYLSAEADVRLDNHPDAILNPVLLHAVHKAKEEERQRRRLEQRRADLAAAGLTDAQIDTAVQEGGTLDAGSYMEVRIRLGTHICLGCRPDIDCKLARWKDHIPLISLCALPFRLVTAKAEGNLSARREWGSLWSYRKLGERCRYPAAQGSASECDIHSPLASHIPHWRAHRHADTR